MFLSRLDLALRSREVKRDLADPYQMHRTLSRGWPAKADYEAARILFRVDETPSGGSIVIVQSAVAPDWASLPPGYCRSQPQHKEWTPRLEVGQRLSFRLMANPTVKREGKRRGLYREHEQLQWLARKAAACGFALPLQEFEIDGQLLPLPAVRLQALGSPMREKRDGGNVVHFTRVQAGISMKSGLDTKSDEAKPSESASTTTGLFCAARFDGTLRITDPDAFVQALENGIGSAKGFGFGLLSVARA